MAHSEALKKQLSQLQNSIQQLLDIDDNPYDTSGFDRELVERLLKLKTALDSSGVCTHDAPVGNSISASVGKGATNKEADVRVVQTLLNNKGASLTVDGQIGNNTINAIIDFQKGIFNGWSDGVIQPGKNTWKALSEGSSSGGNETPPNTGGGEQNGGNQQPSTGSLSASVGRGGTNKESDVLHIQQLLNKAGVEPKLVEDGKIGNNTISAIESIQYRLGMGNPDGLIEPGKNTYKALSSGNIPPAPKPSGKYFSHPGASRVRLKYGDNAVKLNATAEHLLKSILAASGNTSATVTSSYRSYYHQARVMIQYYSIAQMQRLYARGAEFAQLRRQAREDISTFARLLEESDKRQGKLVSLHVTGFAIDVVPDQNRSAYASKGLSLVSVAGSGVKRMLPLGTAGEKVDHIEFTFRVV